MDNLETGSLISWAMELYELGIITDKETDGLDLSWGNAAAMLAMILLLAWLGIILQLAWPWFAGIFLAAVLTVDLIVGALMYLLEGAASGFTSIPRAFYWAIVTMTTVGYGDIAPQTPLGKILASAIMIMGYGIIAVPTGIVTVELAPSPFCNIILAMGLPTMFERPTTTALSPDRSSPR